MKRILLGAALAATLVTAAPANAEARGFLGKSEARRYAAKDVKQLHLRVTWADGYWIESASRCARNGRMEVECDFQIQSDDTVCDDTVIVRLYRDNTYTVRYPYEADCWTP